MLAFQIWYPSCTEQESVISTAESKQALSQMQEPAGLSSEVKV